MTNEELYREVLILQHKNLLMESEIHFEHKQKLQLEQHKLNMECTKLEMEIELLRSKMSADQDFVVMHREPARLTPMTPNLPFGDGPLPPVSTFGRGEFAGYEDHY